MKSCKNSKMAKRSARDRSMRFRSRQETHGFLGLTVWQIDAESEMQCYEIEKWEKR